MCPVEPLALAQGWRSRLCQEMLMTWMTRVNCQDIPAQLLINDLPLSRRVLNTEYQIHPSGCPDGIQDRSIWYSGCKQWILVIWASSPDQTDPKLKINGAYGWNGVDWKHTVIHIYIYRNLNLPVLPVPVPV